MPNLVALVCARCGNQHPADVLQQRCQCGGTLLARYGSVDVPLGEVLARPQGLWRYREFLPLEREPVSLGEVETPLLRADRLSERFGIEIFIKDESPLPSGTFKARGAAVALSRAVELGVKSIVMPSAGNAGGAWALYAARAGIDITVTMARTAPGTNQREVEIAGGTLELVDGTIADAGKRAKEIAAESGAFLASTFNEPFRVDGKKTAWLETFAQLGDGNSMRLPGTIVLPIGGGVAAVAAHKAASEVLENAWVTGEAPKLVGVQPEDCAPIVRAFEKGATDVEPWGGEPTTIAAGLRVPAPGEGDLVLDRVRRTGGTVTAVSEYEIRSAVHDLAASEGLFACPEGATTLAALGHAKVAHELIAPVVLYNTGAGIKYLDVLA